MKGLLLKDLLALKRQGKVLLILIVFYIVYSLMMKNVSMLGAMIILVCVMMPITTLAYDEQCKWDKYALSMPISRKTLVLGKYLFGILLDLAGLAVVALLSIGVVLYSHETSIPEALLTAAATAGIGIIFLSATMPILFKFGVEKGRMLMLVVIILPALLIMLLSRLGMLIPDLETLKLLAFASPVLIVLLLLASIKLSISIYNKKEL